MLTKVQLSYLDATLKKDPSRGTNDALIEIYRRLRPGDFATVENARASNRKHVL